MCYTLDEETKKTTMFEDLVKKLSPNSLGKGLQFEKVSEWINRMTFRVDADSHPPIQSYVVMPFDGMGIFYYDVAKQLDYGMAWSDTKSILLSEVRYFKLNYCMEGRVEVFMQGKGKYAYLEKGMVGFDENDPELRLSFTKDRYRGFGLYFNFELMSEKDLTTLSSFGITKEVARDLIDRDEECFLGKASPEFQGIIEDITHGIEDKTIDLPRARIQSARLLYLLFHDDVVPMEKSEYTTSGQRKIAEEARKIILSEPGVHVTAEEMAERLHCTAPALKKYFRKVHGMPMYSFLQKVRLDKAEESLRNTGKSIAEIAEEAGYANQSKFCSLFKSNYGVTPSEYRRLHS